MARLSQIPAERDLQKYIVAAVGWLIIAVLVLAVLLAPAILDDASGTEDPQPLGFVPVRAGLGVVMSLISLRLGQLVLRHREGIRTVAGLKGQYVLASVVTAVFGVISLFFWWTALLASVVGVVSLVAVIATRPVPREEMTEEVDYRNPEAWGSSGGLPARFARMSIGAKMAVLVGIPLLLVAVSIAGGMAYFAVAGG